MGQFDGAQVAQWCAQPCKAVWLDSFRVVVQVEKKPKTKKSSTKKGLDRFLGPERKPESPESRAFSSGGTDKALGCPLSLDSLLLSMVEVCMRRCETW